MTTITRKQLISAVEAGIEMTREHSATFSLDAAIALRQVATTTKRVARGHYEKEINGTMVGCPVAQAFPGDWLEQGWDLWFVHAYDDAMNACPGVGKFDAILEVVDEPQSV
jgi:hypothetical protein